MDPVGLQIGLVPGLERGVMDDDLWHSHIEQNKLLKDSDIQPVDEEHIAALSRLIEECNAKGIFGIHLGHKHFDLRKGTHLAGRLDTDDDTDDKRKYYWIRAAENDESDASKLCGHIFIYDQDEGFRPIGFHEGPMPDLSTVDRKLFPKFGSYLVEHKLEHRIALEYLIPELRGRAILELVFHVEQHILLFESETVPPSLGEPVVTAYSYDRSGVAFGPGTRYIRPPGSTEHTVYNEDELIRLKGAVNTFRQLDVLRI